MRLGALLNARINRISAGGDGTFGREVVRMSTLGYRTPRNADVREHETGRKYCVWGSSVVGDNCVVGK